MREPCSPRDMPTRRTARAREDRRARRDGDSLLNLKEICNAPSLARPAETDRRTVQQNAARRCRQQLST